MTTLILDTATSKATIVLAEQKKVLDGVVLEGGRGLSEQLLPSIAKLLQQHRKHVKDLKFIACGRGPGSYTGTRVGAMIAKSLAYAHQIPLLGFCSLHAWIPTQQGEFVNLIDAKISGVYLSEGVKMDEGFSYSPPRVCSLEDAHDILDRADYLITSDQRSLSQKLPCFSLSEAPFQPEHLIEIVWDRWLKKDYSLKSELGLLYLREIDS